jgi:signal transduction histidine kinase/ligand-binding sensor domain-containing protein
LTQLGHSAWHVQDGVLPGAPTVIAQTKDGYIWIGTQAGLVRFDGVAFVPVSPPPGDTPFSSRIMALYAAQDGGLWIGTASQLLQLKDGNFHLYPQPVGLFAAVREAPDGKIWATRNHTADDLGPLCEARADDLACYGPKQGVPFKDAGPLAIEQSGAIWVATANKLARWRSGHSETFAPAALARSEGLEGFESVVVAPDGTIWSGVINGGPGLGLQHLTNGTWSPFVSTGMDSSSWEVTTLLFDRDNTLWVGTANRGIYRINGSRIDHFGVGDGLSADFVNGLSEDREGNVWAVTTKGIDKFRPIQVVTFSSRQGLSADGVSAVLASKSGAIWVSNGALEKIDNGMVTSYRERDGLPGKLATALFEDSQGRLWVGADDRVAVLDRNHFTQVRAADRPIGAILEFTQGPASTVWAITALAPSRLVRMSDIEVLESIAPPPGVRIASLAASPDDSLWMGVSDDAKSCDLARYAAGRWEMLPLHNPTYSGACSEVVVRDADTVFVSEPAGIVEWHDGVLRKLTPENGLPCARAFSLVFDRHENLWVYLQCGVAVIKSRQLAEWWNDPAKKLQIRLLDTSDGALPAPPDFHPRAAIGADERVWFANSADLQFVDSKHPLRNPVVPPVRILALHGDGRIFSLASPIALPPLTRDVQIDFTALSFAVPQRVRFQYRLEGWDKGWQTAGSPRQAAYTNLRPGRYRFSVLGANDDGVWNTKGASVEFDIAPAFYQTMWFYALCGLGGIALLYGLYRVRLRQVAAQVRGRLEARLAERERIAREIHDTLLQTFQGLLLRFQVAHELLPERATEAKHGLGSAIERSVRAISEGRDAVQGLRAHPVEGHGLAVALKTLADELASGPAKQEVVFRIDLQGTSRPLHPIVRDEIHQIASEALRNSWRHAHASEIEVELRYDERQLRLRVRDNGGGIDQKFLSREVTRGHFGLQGMRERAELIGGKLTIWTAAGSGTELELTVPAERAYAAKPSRRLAWLAKRVSRKISETA